MHRSAVALALFALATPAAAAQFEGVMESKMLAAGAPQGAMTGTGKMYLSAAGFRMEMSMAAPQGSPAGPGEMKMTTLMLRSRPGVAYLINDARKTYSEIDTSKRADAPGVEPEKYTVQKLGNDRVAGYDCGHALVQGEKGEQYEVWSTKDIGGAAEYWASQRGSRSHAALVEALKEAGLDGWPLKWQQKSKGSGDVTWEVTKVERRPVPASRFDLAGYTKTEGGMLGGGGQMQLSSEQQKRMDEAMKRNQEAMKNLSPEQRKQIEEMMKSKGR